MDLRRETPGRLRLPAQALYAPRLHEWKNEKITTLFKKMDIQEAKMYVSIHLLSPVQYKKPQSVMGFPATFICPILVWLLSKLPWDKRLRRDTHALRWQRSRFDPFQPKFENNRLVLDTVLHRDARLNDAHSVYRYWTGQTPPHSPLPALPGGLSGLSGTQQGTLDTGSLTCWPLA